MHIKMEYQRYLFRKCINIDNKFIIFELHEENNANI